MHVVESPVFDSRHQEKRSQDAPRVFLFNVQNHSLYWFAVLCCGRHGIESTGIFYCRLKSTHSEGCAFVVLTNSRFEACSSCDGLSQSRWPSGMACWPQILGTWWSLTS